MIIPRAPDRAGMTCQPPWRANTEMPSGATKMPSGARAKDAGQRKTLVISDLAAAAVAFATIGFGAASLIRHHLDAASAAVIPTPPAANHNVCGKGSTTANCASSEVYILHSNRAPGLAHVISAWGSGSGERSNALRAGPDQRSRWATGDGRLRGENSALRAGLPGDGGLLSDTADGLGAAPALGWF